MLQQTIWLFFRDMVMGLGLMVVVGPPVVAAIIIIVQKGGPYLALYLWAFMLLLSLVLMAVYPVLIAPLFNKFTPVSLASFWASIWVLNSLWSPICWRIYSSLIFEVCSFLTTAILFYGYVGACWITIFIWLLCSSLSYHVCLSMIVSGLCGGCE